MKRSQSTHNLCLIEPVQFCSNPDTLADNQYQQAQSDSKSSQIQAAALSEFKQLQAALEASGATVRVYRDTIENKTPDSIFPNNWFSTHQDSTLVLYPMKAPSRRRERRADIIQDLQKQYTRLIDLSPNENNAKFLEGTGSLVLDRVNKIAYCCLSERSDRDVLEIWAKQLDYKLFPFRASDENGKAIYHTNVMLSIGTQFAIVCDQALQNQNDSNYLKRSLQKTGHEVFSVSLQQVRQFCANTLEIIGSDSKRHIVMSQQAANALGEISLKRLEVYGEILSVKLDTIETYGGGSARCMIAEMF